MVLIFTESDFFFLLLFMFLDCCTVHAGPKDLSMLVKVFLRVHAEWVAIGYCVNIPRSKMDALEKRWRGM